MDGCPKRMVFGPCGGVRADLGCELGGRPCPIATAPPVRWTGEPVASGLGDRTAVAAGLRDVVAGSATGGRREAG